MIHQLKQCARQGFFSLKPSLFEKNCYFWTKNVFVTPLLGEKIRILSTCLSSESLVKLNRT